METNITDTESATGIETTQKNTGYKAVIVILALAIITVGALLLIQNFGGSKETTSLGSQISSTQGAGDGEVIMEVYEDEDGNINYNEIRPEKE